METPTKTIAWSYSALTTFLNCGKQYYHLNVLKDVKFEENEKSLWGHRVHAFFAEAMAKPDILDSEVGEFSSLVPLARRFSSIKGDLYVEQRVAINSAFEITEYFAPDVWCRGVLDSVWINGNVAKIVDWKTGKYKFDLKQLKLFALLTFCAYPEVNRVNTAFVWTQTGKIDVEKYDREDFAFLWQDILPDVRRLELAFNTQTWVPRPSGLCKGWCPVRSCSFWDGAKSEAIKEKQWPTETTSTAVA